MLTLVFHSCQIHPFHCLLSGSHHFYTGSLQQHSGPPPWLYSQTRSTFPYGRHLTCHSLVKTCQWLPINYVMKSTFLHMVDTALWELATTFLSLHPYLYCTSSSFSWMVFQLPFPSSESQTFGSIWRHLLITIGRQVLLASTGSSFRMLLIMLQCKQRLIQPNYQKCQGWETLLNILCPRCVKMILIFQIGHRY